MEVSKEIENLDIRYTEMGDLPFLKQWLLSPGILHWFPVADEKEAEDALQCWIAFSRWNCSLTATLQDVPCGIATLFLMPYYKVGHHCLFKIIVDPQHQRKGIGFSLLRNLKHLAKNYFKLEMIHGEVIEGNPIISLLQKLDFYQFACQRFFVKEKDCYLNRLLFQTDLSSDASLQSVSNSTTS
jgi:RimJ/RimL family protein N-acetyltransferase